MAIALRGNLKDFGIAEVFQLIGQQGKTGLLQIALDDEAVRLAFDGGRVVWASPVGSSQHAELGQRLVRCGLLTRERLDALIRDGEASARTLPTLLVDSGAVATKDFEQIRDLLTQDTIFQVLRWQDGSFHFTTQALKHDLPPQRLLGAEQILMEGLRMVDEWRTFAPRAPADDSVVGRCGSFDDYRQRAGGEPAARAESVFQLVDGRLSVRRIIDLSRVGTFDGTRYLVGLLDAGVIEPVKSVAAAPKVAGEPRFAMLVAAVRWSLAAALPMALLGLIAWASGQQLLAPPLVQGTRVDALALDRAVASFETRRLRHALEAHRHLWSSWPEDLAAVDRTGWDGPAVLAASEAGSYYYRRRGDGVLVLPPDPGPEP